MWVKICGIRDVETATLVAEAGADALGLNFWPQSPRAVPVDVAAKIATAMADRLTAVGLFVNAGLEELVRTADSVGLESVQLHGDEPPEFVRALKERRPDLKIIRARRVNPVNVTDLAVDIAGCGDCVQAYLIDAHVPGAFGGTGQAAPWQAVAEFWSAARPRMILAGGLTDAIVAEAIRSVRPWGVDTASGVESAPGVKDPAKIRAFVQQARSVGGTARAAPS